MAESIVATKASAFALRIVKLHKYLTMKAPIKEYVMSKQVLRSGTSVGANIEEALRGQSRADFAAKMNISLKEACETRYWLTLLRDSEYIESSAAQSILKDCDEIIIILKSIVKSTNEKR
ncbi:MAG: four helix bundle protein [Bacteroidaceae bacterium]|nr:four helix bundle protein [Bacteroidaceae bacterium]